jgi:hypothetical protein
MPRTLIQQYSSSIIRGLMARIISLTHLDHKLTKGELRELFISEVLKSFLTKQFDIGSGVIINQKGAQSDQTDIIIYDNRILPPFIREQYLGVYPAESVLATIEIKSNLIKREILNAEKSALKIRNNVYSSESSIYSDFKEFRPTCAVIGFYGRGVKELTSNDTGKTWIKDNIYNISYLCLVNEYSWINMLETGWTPEMCDKDLKSNNETKRFIAVLLDNIRTQSEKRLSLMRGEHKDWLGAYLRDWDLGKTKRA